MDTLVTVEPDGFQENRRSTRVPLEVSIEVEDETIHPALKGFTVVVNLHGALIRTIKPLKAGTRIHLTVYLTGKSSQAQVVYVTKENVLQCGIELAEPRNIWGVSLPPDDWEDARR